MYVVDRYPPAVDLLSVEYCNRNSPQWGFVDLAELRIDRQSLDPKKLESLLFFDAHPPISVVRYRGVLYCWDGRHRAWIAAIRGTKQLQGWIQDIE